MFKFGGNFRGRQSIKVFPCVRTRAIAIVNVWTMLYRSTLRSTAQGRFEVEKHMCLTYLHFFQQVPVPDFVVNRELRPIVSEKPRKVNESGSIAAKPIMEFNYRDFFSRKTFWSSTESQNLVVLLLVPLFPFSCLYCQPFWAFLVIMATFLNNLSPTAKYFLSKVLFGGVFSRSETHSTKHSYSPTLPHENLFFSYRFSSPNTNSLSCNDSGSLSQA